VVYHTSPEMMAVSFWQRLPVFVSIGLSIVL